MTFLYMTMIGHVYTMQIHTTSQHCSPLCSCGIPSHFTYISYLFYHPLFVPLYL